MTPASLANAEITVTNEDALVFSPDQSGQATTVAAQIKVELDGKELTVGTDYTVSGNQQTNAGSYELTITGTGNYTGTKTVGWEIKKNTVEVRDIADIIKTYDGTTALPDGFALGKFKIQDVNKTGVTDVSLTTGTDYTMTGHYTDADAGSGKTVRLQLTIQSGKDHRICEAISFRAKDSDIYGNIGMKMCLSKHKRMERNVCMIMNGV